MLFAFLTFANYQKYTSFRKHSIGKKKSAIWCQCVPFENVFSGISVALAFYCVPVCAQCPLHYTDSLPDDSAQTNLTCSDIPCFNL